MSDRSVAVIGGGISGLVCACRLAQLGIRNVVVFDTGSHSAGGRCSTRHVKIQGYTYIFDHSAQYFTVSSPQFAKVVSFLHRQGAVKLWDGPIGNISKSGQFTRYPKDFQAFIGSSGMRAVSECLASQVQLQQPVWVGELQWEASERKWRVDKYGYYDYVVIAHNGKCADKLMSNAGAPKVHGLLQVRFGAELNPRDARMQLCSLWVLLVAFPKSLKLPYEGAHVDDKDISWVANNTAKLNQNITQGIPGLSSAKSQDSLECWTILSTKHFATANKVPQEHIPTKKASEVTEALLNAFARITQLSRDQLKPCYSRVQLWGAAVPMNTLQVPDRCVFDGDHQVAVCGDWLVSPSIQGAALSGLSAAERIAQHAQGTKRSSTGLEPHFERAPGTSIGDFPTSATLTFNAYTHSFVTSRALTPIWR